jgi:hypothetical protein
LFEGCPESIINVSKYAFTYVITTVPTYIVKELKYVLNFIDDDKMKKENRTAEFIGKALCAPFVIN